MTLKDAYTEWAAIPENTAQAARNRSAMDSILLLKYGKSDVCEFTAFRVRKIMSEYKEVTESIKGMKIRTASILAQVLTYAASKGACLKPEFDYTIVNSSKDSSTVSTKDTNSDSPTKGPTPRNSVQQEEASEASQKVLGQESSEGAIAPEPTLRNENEKYPTRFKPGHVPATKGKKWDDIMSKEKQENCKKGWKNIIEHRAPHSPNSGRKKIPVVQLDPETLQEVAHFEDIASAGRSTGVCNIQRAMNDHKMSGGYYWARPEDVEGFEPGYKRGPKTTTWSRKKKEETKAVAKQADTKGSRMSEENEVVGKPVSGGPDKNCPAVCPGKPLDKSALERGGAMPQAANAAVVERTPLSSFTDDELKGELCRRGLYGTLYQQLVFPAYHHDDK